MLLVKFSGCEGVGERKKTQTQHKQREEDTSERGSACSKPRDCDGICGFFRFSMRLVAVEAGLDVRPVHEELALLVALAFALAAAADASGGHEHLALLAALSPQLGRA